MSSYREPMVRISPHQNRSKSDRWLLIFMIVTAVYTYEETTANSRVCHYDANGVEYILAIQKIYSCPFTIEVEQ